MSVQVMIVPNDKVEEAKTRAEQRGATVKVEKLNGNSKLTATYPPLGP